MSYSFHVRCLQLYMYIVLQLPSLSPPSPPLNRILPILYHYTLVWISAGSKSPTLDLQQRLLEGF